LDIGTSVIWLAFALEFLVLVSVAESKPRYCLKHWMDLAVVLLPLVDFLPLLRLLRLTRLMELQQVGRLYRLRSLIGRIWRAVLAFEAIRLLFGYTREQKLKRLKDTLAARQAEIDALGQEIAELEDLLAKETAPK